MAGPAKEERATSPDNRMTGPPKGDRKEKDRPKSERKEQQESTPARKQAPAPAPKPKPKPAKSRREDDWEVRRKSNRRGRRYKWEGVEVIDFSAPRVRERSTAKPDWWFPKAKPPVEKGPTQNEIAERLEKHASIRLTPQNFAEIAADHQYIRKGKIRYRVELEIFLNTKTYIEDAFPEIVARDSSGTKLDVEWNKRRWKWIRRPRTDPRVYWRPERPTLDHKREGWLLGGRGSTISVPIWVPTERAFEIIVSFVHRRTKKVLRKLTWPKDKAPSDLLPDRFPLQIPPRPYIDQADVIDYNHAKSQLVLCSKDISVSDDTVGRSAECKRIGGKRIRVSYRGFIFGSPKSSEPYLLKYAYDRRYGRYFPVIESARPEPFPKRAPKPDVEALNPLTTPNLFSYFWDYVVPAMEEEQHRMAVAGAFLAWLPFYVGEGYVLPKGMQKVVPKGTARVAKRTEAAGAKAKVVKEEIDSIPGSAGRAKNNKATGNKALYDGDRPPYFELKTDKMLLRPTTKAESQAFGNTVEEIFSKDPDVVSLNKIQTNFPVFDTLKGTAHEGALISETASQNHLTLWAKFKKMFGGLDAPSDLQKFKKAVALLKKNRLIGEEVVDASFDVVDRALLGVHSVGDVSATTFRKWLREKLKGSIADYSTGLSASGNRIRLSKGIEWYASRLRKRGFSDEEILEMILDKVKDFVLVAPK